jgi:hypothetical protein
LDMATTLRCSQWLAKLASAKDLRRRRTTRLRACASLSQFAPGCVRRRERAGEVDALLPPTPLSRVDYGLAANTIVTGLAFLITWPVGASVPEYASTWNVTMLSPASLAA